MNDHNNAGRGGWFLVAAAVVYDIVAATNSSPQTTEINARLRAHTLMKWVHIGLAQAVAFILLAAMGDRKNRGPILAGGGLASVAMYYQYVYAKKCGMESSEPPTEDFGQNGTGHRHHARSR